MDRLAALQHLTRELANKGQLMEAGWAGFLLILGEMWWRRPQPDDVRCAYMAGVCHAFRAVMGALDEDAEPTDADLVRMEKINAEVELYEQEIEKAFPGAMRARARARRDGDGASQ